MNIFIDCGFYTGGALRKYIDRKIVDESWTVYAFGPNPEVEVDLNDFKPIKVKLIKKAVWVKGGKVPFWLSLRRDACHVDDTTTSARDKQITVPSIDFSKFVSKLPQEAHIVCSMDIEGSEFRVLQAMLEDGSIDRINVLDIEFHHRFMPTHEAKDARRLINAIRKRGIKVKLKVPLQ